MITQIAVRRTVTQVGILVAVIIARLPGLLVSAVLNPTTNNSEKSVSSLRSH